MGAALATLVIFGAGGYMVHGVVGRQLEQQAIEQAKKNANLLAIRVNRGSHAMADGTSYAIIGADGEMWFTSGLFRGNGPLANAPLLTAPEDQESHSVRVVKMRFPAWKLPPDPYYVGMSMRPRVLRVAMSVTGPMSSLEITALRHGGELPPEADLLPAQRVTVYVVESPDTAEKAMNSIQRVSTWTMSVAVLFVTLVAWFATGRALRPVEAIRARMAVITAHGSAQRVPVPSTGDELTSLAVTINATLDRLERALAEQRRFVVDASHELRSPLTNLRSSLEVALTHPDRDDWPAVVTAALTDTERLQQLAEDLLVLARVDHGVRSSGVVDLAGVVAEQMAERAHTDHTGIEYTADVTGSVLVVGTESDLQRVLRNLLDNAARHSRTTVTARVTERDDAAVLTISDDGPGIPPGDRERVFERFVRLDDGRGRTEGGVGLGLAIVRGIVTHLGGNVHVTDRATITVSLPLATDHVPTDMTTRAAGHSPGEDTASGNSDPAT